MGNDNRFGYRMRLASQTGYNVTIRSDGEVLGTDDDADAANLLEISSGGDVGYVRIQGLNSKLYLCFSSEGVVYGEEDSSNEGTMFLENFVGAYTTYQSKIDPEWYLGIRKNGLMKKGTQKNYTMKAIKFLPRRL
ncbi:hypothetical protein JTB14_012069 [Gonioctena quinquepunctata]|nr:hypothetical protein JTB14_012069 [Gonioctena quinquepunctata]